MRKIFIPFYTFFALSIFNVAISAQTINQNTNNDVSCEGTIYKASELKKPAVLITRPKAELTDEARAHDVSGRVKLKAVLCRSGKVTDVKVIESLPFNVTEKMLEAVRKITFIPAEANGQAASQELIIDFSFSYLGEPRSLATGKLEGRVIESIDTEGYSENMEAEVKKCIRLLGGEAYNKEQIEQVWQRLLKLENFDPTTSQLRIEEGERGGLGIVFLLEKKQKN